MSMGLTLCWSPRVSLFGADIWSTWLPRLCSLQSPLFDNRWRSMSKVIKPVCSSKINLLIFLPIPHLSWYSTTFITSLFINNPSWHWFKMPTTRQKREPAEDLLPGLPMDEKRPKRSTGSEASSSRAPKAKPAAKKGKGKQVLYPLDLVSSI